jgi:hypothetical protein
MSICDLKQLYRHDRSPLSYFIYIYIVCVCVCESLSASRVSGFLWYYTWSNITRYALFLAAGAQISLFFTTLGMFPKIMIIVRFFSPLSVNIALTRNVTSPLYSVQHRKLQVLRPFTKLSQSLQLNLITNRFLTPVYTNVLMTEWEADIPFGECLLDIVIIHFHQRLKKNT